MAYVRSQSVQIFGVGPNLRHRRHYRGFDGRCGLQRLWQRRLLERMIELNRGKVRGDFCLLRGHGAKILWRFFYLRGHRANSCGGHFVFRHGYFALRGYRAKIRGDFCRLRGSFSIHQLDSALNPEIFEFFDSISVLVTIWQMARYSVTIWQRRNHLRHCQIVTPLIPMI